MTNQAWKLMTIREEAIEYKIDGEAKDHEWLLANRKTLESHMFEEMRLSGILPILDRDTNLSFDFKPDTETFTFELSSTGYRVGTEALDWLGIIYDEGVLISPDYKRVALCDGL